MLIKKIVKISLKLVYKPSPYDALFQNIYGFVYVSALVFEPTWYNENLLCFYVLDKPKNAIQPIFSV